MLIAQAICEQVGVTFPQEEEQEEGSDLVPLSANLVVAVGPFNDCLWPVFKHRTRKGRKSLFTGFLRIFVSRASVHCRKCDTYPTCVLVDAKAHLHQCYDEDMIQKGERILYTKEPDSIGQVVCISVSVSGNSANFHALSKPCNLVRELG